MIKKFFKLETFYWLLLSCFALILHWNNPFNSDEGVILEGAWNMFNHKELYTHFFEFVAPGSFYFVFIFWKLLFPSYYVAKFFSLVLLIGTGAGIFKISTLLEKTRHNYLPPLIFIVTSFNWPIINHNTHNLFFLVFASYFFAKGLTKDSKLNFSLSGLFSGIAILFLQQKGVVLVAVLFVYLILLSLYSKKIDYFYQALRYAGASLVSLSIIFFKWPVELLYENLIKFPLAGYVEINKVPYTLFLLFLALTFTFGFILKKTKSKIVYFLLFLQFALLLTTLSRPDYFHIILVIFPLLTLSPSITRIIAIYLKSLKNPYSKLFKIILGGISAALFILFVLIILERPDSKKESSKEIVKYIEENCPRQNDLYAGPFTPGLYFEAKKINPTFYYILLTELQNKEVFESVKNDLADNKPECIAMNYEICEKFNYSKDNVVDDFIKKHYSFDKKIANTEFFRLNK